MPAGLALRASRAVMLGVETALVPALLLLLLPLPPLLLLLHVLWVVSVLEGTDPCQGSLRFPPVPVGRQSRA